MNHHPAKIHLVTGFLGSGKTTLLRHLLAKGLNGERVAVLVNEFGEIGIDGALLRKDGHQVVELTSGCVCCQIGADMVATVCRMLADYQPARIVFELTGVADAGAVLAELSGSTDLYARLRFEPTVCVVDAQAYPELRIKLEYGYYCQIQAADVVLLNKIDLVDADQLAAVEAAVREHNPRALLLFTKQCEVDLPSLFDRPYHMEISQVEGHHHPHGPDLTSFVLQDPDSVFSRSFLEHWLQQMPADLFRLKGTVRCREGVFFVNWVRGGCSWEPAADNDVPPTTLVCIGHNVEQEQLRAGLAACASRRRGIHLSGA